MGQELKIDNYKILRKWKKDMGVLMSTLYPDIEKEEMNGFLNHVIKENLKRDDMVLNNTYQEKELWSDTLDVSEYYFKGKPATGGNGVLFHPTKFNPALKMLESFGDRRKQFKKERQEFPEDSFEFADRDLKQNNEKVKMNAWYGINGSPTCIFFNLECATGITGKGKMLTSLANCSFEAFLGNNILFLDMNDCLMFIKNILKEKRKFKSKDIIDRNISKLRVLQHLRKQFDEDCEDYDEKLLEQLLNNCSKEDLNRIYYKNNLHAFFKNKKIKELYREAINKTDIYVNPDEKKTPEYLRNILDEIWDYVEEFVLYRHEYTDRVYRTKYKKRGRVLVIDTDSKLESIKLFNCWESFMSKSAA